MDNIKIVYSINDIIKINNLLINNNKDFMSVYVYDYYLSGLNN